MSVSEVFDVIVVGSGITGGWAAKELCEKNLRVLLVESGRSVEHQKDYLFEGKEPWRFSLRGEVANALKQQQHIQSRNYAYNDATRQYFINDQQFPYQTEGNTEFTWLRGDQLGGKSLLWHRQSYRMSDLDFNANKTDGHGNDWPIRYADLKPWYDHVERFVGISGSHENLDVLPDGVFQKPFAMNAAELNVKARIEKRFSDRKLLIGRTAHLTEPSEEQKALGRYNCMARNECQKGCSFGAYFSTQSSTLPAARRTGNLTVVTDALVDQVLYDEKRKKASGVSVIDRNTRERKTFSGRAVFLCASTLNTTQIMLNSRSESFPNGIANTSGVLGKFLMGHVRSHISATVPGFENEYFYGRRPTGLLMPRFVNVDRQDQNFIRGYSYFSQVSRDNWQGKRFDVSGIGKEFKAQLRTPGHWKFVLQGIGEMLPDEKNKVTLNTQATDAYGMPTLSIHCQLGENDIKLREHSRKTAVEMMQVIGCENIQAGSVNKSNSAKKIFHEVGTARMGKDPKESVLNANNQCHDVPNLFVTDGAAWCSTGWVNPSLTFMAITARAANFAAEALHSKSI